VAWGSKEIKEKAPAQEDGEKLPTQGPGAAVFFRRAKSDT